MLTKPPGSPIPLPLVRRTIAMRSAGSAASVITRRSRCRLAGVGSSTLSVTPSAEGVDEPVAEPRAERRLCLGVLPDFVSVGQPVWLAGVLDDDPPLLGGLAFEPQRLDVGVAQQLGVLARSGELACGEVARLALHSLHLTFDEHSAKSGAERAEEREGGQSLRRVHEHDPVVEEIRVRRRPRPEKAAPLRESAHTLNEGHASSLSHFCASSMASEDRKAGIPKAASEPDGGRTPIGKRCNGGLTQAK